MTAEVWSLTAVFGQCVQLVDESFLCPCGLPECVQTFAAQASKAPALGCSKDLICSRGLVAVSKWPVETLTGARSVDGESNLISRQKSLTGFWLSLALLLPLQHRDLQNMSLLDAHTNTHMWLVCHNRLAHLLFRYMLRLLCGLFIQL